MKKLDYETLAMEEIVVEMENGFLAASQKAIIKEETEITIEEYQEIGNEITFD